MNTMAKTPVPGLAPDFSVKPAAAVAAVADIASAVVPSVRRSTLRRVKDTLVAIYAYGLLLFGLFFPLLLAAWHIFLRPAAQ